MDAGDIAATGVCAATDTDTLAVVAPVSVPALRDVLLALLTLGGRG